MRSYWNPTLVHYAALPVSFLLILVVGRDQWFFGDDWAILAPGVDGDVMAPHMGHWNLVPAVVFPLIRNIVGLDSYLPYLALSVLAHLGVAHLLWRILRRVGTLPWIATMLSIFVMLLGGAAENLLWAFQFGFMGAIAVALGVVLLADRERLSWPVGGGMVLLSVLAPMFSGTAIPVLAAAAVVAWVRHGIIRATLLLGPAALSYLAWYLLLARDSAVPSAGIREFGDLAVAAVYAAAMYGGGLGRALPWIALGILPALAVVVWFIATVRRRVSSAAAPAYALAIGSVVFVALTTWSRMSFGITAAAAPRYAYVMVVLLVPAFGIMLSWLAARSTRWFVVAVLTLVGLIVFNVATLVVEGAGQAKREAGSRERVMQSAYRVLSSPLDADLLSSTADPEWAPDLRGEDLLWLVEHGQLTVKIPAGR